MSKLGTVVAAIIAACTLAVAFTAWQALSDIEISKAGLFAMIAGTLLTVGLAGGLVALLYYSNRKGFDEEAGGHVLRRPHDD